MTEEMKTQVKQLAEEVGAGASWVGRIGPVFLLYMQWHVSP